MATTKGDFNIIFKKLEELSKDDEFLYIVHEKAEFDEVRELREIVQQIQTSPLCFSSST